MKRPRRPLDYEALAIAAFLITPSLRGTFFDMIGISTPQVRTLMQHLGVEKPTSHEARLFRRAVHRLRSAP